MPSNVQGHMWPKLSVKIMSNVSQMKGWGFHNRGGGGGFIKTVYMCDGFFSKHFTGNLPLVKHASRESDWLLCWHYTLAKVLHQR